MKTDYLDVLAHCDTCTVPPGVRCESAPGSCPYAAPKMPEKDQKTGQFQEKTPE